MKKSNIGPLSGMIDFLRFNKNKNEEPNQKMKIIEEEKKESKQKVFRRNSESSAFSDWANDQEEKKNNRKFTTDKSNSMNSSMYNLKFTGIIHKSKETLGVNQTYDEEGIGNCKFYSKHI
jgi:hypothetical protein